MAQDDYYYEIQLTNKQLVFYFLAGATVLILCFLAGIMVGRGVDVHGGEPRVARDEAVTPIGEDRSVAGTPRAAESYSYAQRLVTERVQESMSTPPAGSRSPLPGATRRIEGASSAPRTAPTPAPVVAKATPSPKPTATPKPRVTPTPRARATPTPRALPSPGGGKAGSESPLSLQVGAFKDRASADAVSAQLRRKGYTAHVINPDGARDGLYIVRVGPYKTRVDAERARTRLEQERFKPFIVRQ